MRVWTFEEAQEQFDAMLDAAEADGPQLIQYGDKTMILTTREDYENRLAGRNFKVDEFLAAKAPTGESLAMIAESGKSVWRFFTNTGKMITPGD
jgi:hypothetical protein